MKVKNVSSRLHHVGDVMVIPGEAATVSDEYANSINRAELEVVEAPATKPAAKAGTSTKAAAPQAPTPAPVQPAPATVAPWEPQAPQGDGQ